MNEVTPKVAALLDQAKWHEERKALRAILLDCPLVEEVKWNKLCYTFRNSNVAILYGLKDYCGLGFFKGALLQDPKGILCRQGQHSQAMRLIRFTDVREIVKMEPTLKAYIHNAIKVEKAGLTVDFKEKHELVYPDELRDRLKDDPAFREAFEALTPGRRRGYNLHFSAAKQSKTRAARIEKCASRILAGKGLNDR